MESIFSLQNRCAKTRLPAALEKDAAMLSRSINELETERRRAGANLAKINGILESGLEAGSLHPRRVIELENDLAEDKRFIQACDLIISAKKNRLKEALEALTRARTLVKQLHREIEERNQMITAGEKDLQRVFNPVLPRDRAVIVQKIGQCQEEIKQIEAIAATFPQGTEPANLVQILDGQP